MARRPSLLVAGVLLLERATLWRLRTASNYRASPAVSAPIELKIDENNLVRGMHFSKITPEELVLIETYLQRRDTLDFGYRDATALKLANRLTARTGIERPTSQPLDEFLEGIARQGRDGARFR